MSAHHDVVTPIVPEPRTLYANIKTVERNWDLTTESLTTAVRLISSFGFSGMSFGKQNAVMIIAYYLSSRPDRNRFLEAPDSCEDRGAVRRWLMTVQVKRGFWGEHRRFAGPCPHHQKHVLH